MQISIPLWFDCEVYTPSTGLSIHRFQFHYGSIVRGRKGMPLPVHISISIPLWFDCEAATLDLPIDPNLFQFHYGSIVSYFFKHFHFILKLFQFHYGSIVSRKAIESARGNLKISIPLWFDCEDISEFFVEGTNANFNSTMVRL